MQKKFWGGRHWRLDLRAYGAQAQRDTPRKKILVTALPATYSILHRNARSPAGEPILVHEWTRPHG